MLSKREKIMPAIIPETVKISPNTRIFVTIRMIPRITTKYMAKMVKCFLSMLKYTITVKPLQLIFNYLLITSG